MESSLVLNQPHDEEVLLSDSDSLLDGDDEDLAIDGDHQDRDVGGSAESPPVHYDGDNAGYDDTASESDLRYQDTVRREYSYDNAQDDASSPSKDGANSELSMEDLFQYIGRYKPQSATLETKIKPFIPDYFPAVGDVDEFLKVPRPDGKPDDLGLKTLDEPAITQSEPAILNLQLRANSKQAFAKPVQVGYLDDAANQVDKIDSWVANIREIQKNRGSSTFNYSKSMPDIESLMKEWPPEVEEVIQTMKMPNGHIGLTLPDLVQVLCNALDIPVYDNPIESLHVMFSLFLEFKNNPYFNGGEHPQQHPDANTLSFD